MNSPRLFVLASLVLPLFACSHAPQAPHAADIVHPLATSELQAAATPDSVFDELKQGHARFLSGKTHAHRFSDEIRVTAEKQFPRAVVLSCIDSRAPAELVFDQGLGDVFNVRIAGNTVNEDILGSMEYATKVAGAKLIVVMGHTACGGLKGAADRVKLGNLTTLLKRFDQPVASVEKKKVGKRDSHDHAFMDALTLENMEFVRRQILARSSVIRALVDEGKVKIVSGVYDVATGNIQWM